MHRTLRRSVALAAAQIALVASAAAAHPSLNPNQLTAGEPHQVQVVVPHGCTGTGQPPAEGETGSPTTEFALQLREEIASITAAEVEGWTVARDGDALVWTATDGGTPDVISFPVTLEVAGGVETGTTLHLVASQVCVEGSMLWDAMSEADGLPAVLLVVGDEVGTAEHGDGEDHSSHGEGAMGSEDGHDMEGEHGEGEHGDDLAAEEAKAAGDDPLGLLALVMLVVVVGSLTVMIRGLGSKD